MDYSTSARRPQRDELDDPWPLKALLWLALWPWFGILTVASHLPVGLGGMEVPTKFPSLAVLFAWCWPLTLLQAGLGLFFSPLLLLDYWRYLDEIGERGKTLPHNPKGGVEHGVATWLFTRYLEHPLFKIDTLQPDEAMLRAARGREGAGGKEEQARRHLLRPLPYRKGERPVIMQGLPQRQLTQLPPPDETSLLNNLVFDGYLASMGDRVVVGRSLQEGTGALGARWRDRAHCCEDLRRNKQEFAHQHSLDKSWHVLLSPADALEVLAKGWGERGPPQVALGMAPLGMMLVYAPRVETERMVFLDILAASLHYCDAATAPTTGNKKKGDKEQHGGQ